MYRRLLNFFSKNEALIWGRRLKPLYSNTRRLLNPPKCGPYLSNYCNLQFKSLFHLGQNVITFRTLLQLGQNVITFRTLLHLGSFITFRPSTPVNKNIYWVILAYQTWRLRHQYSTLWGAHTQKPVLSNTSCAKWCTHSKDALEVSLTRPFVHFFAVTARLQSESA